MHVPRHRELRPDWWHRREKTRGSEIITMGSNGTDQNRRWSTTDLKTVKVREPKRVYTTTIR